jgi:hypothetical protein
LGLDFGLKEVEKSKVEKSNGVGFLDSSTFNSSTSLGEAHSWTLEVHRLEPGSALEREGGACAF